MSPSPALLPSFGLPRRGMMLILSSPSGAGKTTLTRDLLRDAALDLTLSVSVTTRPRRSSEVEGIHYYFKSLDEFERLRQGDEFLEWAEVHGNFYGTLRRPVEAVLEAGRDVVFDIDFQGTLQVRQRAPDDVVSVFILPPSMSELRARLERRAEDSKDVIERRMRNGLHEIEHWTLYDYVVVNFDLQVALQEVRSILIAERLRRTRQHGLAAFVERLLD